MSCAPYPRWPSAVLLVLFMWVPMVPAASADAVLGFREDFPGTLTGGWTGGVPISNNPGTGGVLGDGDGFLYAATLSGSNWAQHCKYCPEYAGDWSAAGITQVRVWLKDIGDPDPFEIHFNVGNETTQFQLNAGFSPPNDRWAEYVIDLTNESDFTRIIGDVGSLTDVLQGVTNVQLRHDKSPFMWTPDTIRGDAGIDRLLLTNGVVGVEPPRGATVRALQLEPPYPNPSGGAVEFAVRSHDDGPVTLQIIDVSGRVVRREVLAPGPRGTWHWDGRDAAGRLAPPGTYRIVARGLSGGMSLPFALIR
jgi:FlgD Ig-like domain